MFKGDFGDQDMADQEQAEVRLMVARLRQEHEDYDVAINAMIKTGCDALRIQRMKKKKLGIKDKIEQARGPDHSRHHRLKKRTRRR